MINPYRFGLAANHAPAEAARSPSAGAALDTQRLLCRTARRIRLAGGFRIEPCRQPPLKAAAPDTPGESADRKSRTYSRCPTHPSELSRKFPKSGIALAGVCSGEGEIIGIGVVGQPPRPTAPGRTATARTVRTYENRQSNDCLFSKCRGDWIRTSDLQLPKLAR